MEHTDWRLNTDWIETEYDKLKRNSRMKSNNAWDTNQLQETKLKINDQWTNDAMNK